MTRSRPRTSSCRTTSSTSWRRTTSPTSPAGSEPPRRGTTPASRLLFWIRSAFVGDALVAAFGGILFAVGREDAARTVLVFVAIRAGLGVIALLIASRALEQRHPNDDSPSAIR